MLSSWSLKSFNHHTTIFKSTKFKNLDLTLMSKTFILDICFLYHILNFFFLIYLNNYKNIDFAKL